MLPDISEIGEFVYSWDFNKKDYQEYLIDSELEDTEDVFMEYINDEVSFSMEFLDNETYHTFARATNISLSEIKETYGEKLANVVLQDCLKNNEGRVETLLLYDEDIDINDKNQLNNMAKTLLQHGDYYKDCRGFILSDGTVVYTPNEHNQCTVINGVKGTYHFISLGNIRVLPNSIDIGQEPTFEQEQVLRQVINEYADDILYLDIFDNGTQIGVQYRNPQWRFVINEIKRYYREGIKPTGRDLYEQSFRNRIRQNLIENIVRAVLREIYNTK